MCNVPLFCSFASNRQKINSEAYRGATNIRLCVLRGSYDVAPDRPSVVWISASDEYTVLHGRMVEDGKGGRRAGGVLNLLLALAI